MPSSLPKGWCSLNAITITIAWSIIFFFASAGASAAYLTASEIFPIETRAMAIAFIYAVGTLAGGAAAPTIFGALIATQHAINVFYGYLVGAGLMIAGGLVEFFFGVDAEGKSLEDVGAPLSQATSTPGLQSSLAATATA
ncbi:MAG TPA: MFS transporter [Chloroflexota bacterium]|nr:MFS transporter [Chloroflexota bacterium]